MSIGGVVIQFTADADKARRDINKLSGSLEKVGDQASKSSGRMRSLAKVGVAAVAAGAAVGVAALAKFAKAASDDYKEQQALHDILKKFPGITADMVAANDDWIASLELATNIADKDLRESLGKLVVATGDLAQAQKLGALAADLSVARNMSLAEATTLLERAAAGNTNQLKRQFPWLDKNKDGTITLSEAVNGLRKRYKGAAEAVADRSPWERIMTIWGNIQEALGQFILPLLEEFGQWFKSKKNQQAILDWIGMVGDWSREIGEKLVVKIQELYAWLSSPGGQAAIKEWGDRLQSLADGAVKAFDALEPLIDIVGKLLSLYDKTPAVFKGLLGLGEVGRGPVPAPRVNVSSEQQRALSEGRSSRTVNVVVNNPKPEKAVDSAALGIRLARTVGY